MRKGKIAEEVVKFIMSWWHSGFNVHCGPGDSTGRRRGHGKPRPAHRPRVILQERMTYIPDESKVVYRSKDGKSEKTFDALEGMAAMCSHVRNKGEQMVRYYG